MRAKNPVELMVVLFAVFSSAAFGEEVLLKNGNRLTGKVLKEDKTKLQLLFRDQVSVTLSKDRIVQVNNEPARVDFKAKKPPNGFISTSHLVVLENGRKIKCNLINEGPNEFVFAIVPLGTFKVPKERVARIKEKAGEIHVAPERALRQPKTDNKKTGKQPSEKPKAEKAKQVNGTGERPQLTPPPVPEGKKEEINYWLHHLQRERAKNRVQAERHLKAMGEVVVGPVLPLTDRPEWLIRCAALRILAEAGHPAGIQAMWEALSDPHAVVRKVADQSLTKVTGHEIPFDPKGHLRFRKRAVRKWEQYLRKKNLLPTRGKQKKSGG